MLEKLLRGGSSPGICPAQEPQQREMGFCVGELSLWVSAAMCAASKRTQDGGGAGNRRNADEISLMDQQLQSGIHHHPPSHSLGGWSLCVSSTNTEFWGLNLPVLDAGRAEISWFMQLELRHDVRATRYLGVRGSAGAQAQREKAETFQILPAGGYNRSYINGNGWVYRQEG